MRKLKRSNLKIKEQSYKMERYSNAKIYMIEPICEYEEGEVYIGSTCKKYLSQRFSVHYTAYKQWQKGKGKNVSSYRLFEKYGVENCRIVLLEDYPCDTKNQLLAREAYYQKSMKCVNKKIAFWSEEEHKEYQQQYRVENKEYLSEINKKYREEHKEEITQKKKETMECICGSIGRISDYKRHCRTKKHQRYIEENQIKEDY